MYKQIGMRSLELFWPCSILAKNLGDVLARSLSIETLLLGWKMTDRFHELSYGNKLGDWIKTITGTEHGYCKILWFVIVLPINYLFQLLAADKSQYFAQLRPIIVNYFLKEDNVTNSAICMVLSAVRIFYLWPRLRWSFCEFLFFSLQDKERINNLPKAANAVFCYLNKDQWTICKNRTTLFSFWNVSMFQTSSSQAAQARNARSYSVAKRDMGHILHYLTRETWLSPCSIWRCCITTVLLEISILLTFSE